MKISSQIGHSHVEAMNLILRFIVSFNVHRLLYAISEKRLDEDAIRSITLDVEEKIISLKRQTLYLERFSMNYNNEWPADDNQCLDTSARLTLRMRSGIKGIKDQVMSFYKKSRRRLPEGQEAPQAIDHSLISPKETYISDLFGLETYPECVHELFLAMISFHDQMHVCLNISLGALSEEKETRQDVRRCLELMAEAREKSRKNLIAILEAIDSNPALKKVIMQSESLQPTDANPVLKAWVESRGDNDTESRFAAEYFHNCTQKDVDNLELFMVVSEAGGDRNLVECMTIFNCGAERARNINSAICRFDSFLPEKCKGNKVPATYLYVFMKWCGDGVGYETFLNYFFKHYKAAGGTRDRIEKSSLSGAAHKAARNDRQFENVQRKLLETLNAAYPPESLTETA